VDLQSLEARRGWIRFGYSDDQTISCFYFRGYCYFKWMQDSTWSAPRSSSASYLLFDI